MRLAVSEQVQILSPGLLLSRSSMVATIDSDRCTEIALYFYHLIMLAIHLILLLRSKLHLSSLRVLDSSGIQNAGCVTSAFSHSLPTEFDEASDELLVS